MNTYPTVAALEFVFTVDQTKSLCEQHHFRNAPQSFRFVFCFRFAGFQAGELHALLGRAHQDYRLRCVWFFSGALESLTMLGVGGALTSRVD